MHRSFVTTAAAIVLGVVHSFAAPQQVFRSTADVVPLFVTAAEKGGRLVTDLGRDEHDDRRERSPAHSGEIISPIQHRRRPARCRPRGPGRPAQELGSQTQLSGGALALH